MAWREQLSVGELTVTRMLDASGAAAIGVGPSLMAKTYYVDRNQLGSGDGLSWRTAFKTIGEAITKVNLDYSLGVGLSKGRNREIVIGEGWYSEPTMTLTASDCLIRGIAAGQMARTVLYGSLTAGGWDDGNTGPALGITGWNNTIANMDFVNRSATIAGVYSGGVVHTEHPCILEGTYAQAVAYNRYVGLGFMRDQADAASWGIISYSMDHTLIEDCIFNGRSLKEGGIAFQSSTGTNHSADIARRNYFYGTPTGIWQNSSHNTWIHDNFFADQGATTETITNPCDIAGGTAYMFDNKSPDTNLADFNAGANGIEKNNLCSDSAAANTPAS